MARSPKGFPDHFPVRDDDGRSLRYRLASWSARAYIRLLSRRRLSIRGEENIPAHGPLLVVCNHVSNLDPLVFGGYFPRTLFALAKRELYSWRVAAWFLAGCNCIPVDRGAADRQAVTRALDVLAHGGRLLLFLEGTRSHDGTMHRAEAGAGFLARRSRAAILPAAVAGTDSHGRRGLRLRRPATLRYGAPFTLDLEGRRDDARISDEIAARVAALLPVERRGVYATAARAHDTPPAEPHP